MYINYNRLGKSMVSSSTMKWLNEQLKIIFRQTIEWCMQPPPPNIWQFFLYLFVLGASSVHIKNWLSTVKTGACKLHRLLPF